MTQDRQTTVIARTVTRTVVPIIVVTSVALLLQGHNLPGGGFIAGVLTCTALALTYVIYGIDFLQYDLFDAERGGEGVLQGMTGVYVAAFASGLAIAAGSGMVAVLAGHQFLTQAVVLFHGVPLYGEFELASAFVFDLGVYLVVVGGLMTVVSVVGSE